MARGPIVLVPFLAACFYDVPPLASDASTDAGVAIDAPPDVGPLACSKPPGACLGALPAGWKPIAFETSRNATCPSNFVSSDLVASPNAAKNACTCNCTITTQPSCAKGSVQYRYGGGACGGGPQTFNVSDGVCVDFGNTFNETAYNAWTALGLTAGTCSTAPLVDMTKVTSTASRACVPPPTCEEDVCGGLAPAGFRACVTRDGDQACPAPFLQRVLAGSTATATCSACTCQVSASCGTATVRVYGDAQCTNQLDALVADGKCNLTNGATGVNHFKYDSPPQNVSCQASGGNPTADLMDKRTICCR